MNFGMKVEKFKEIACIEINMKRVGLEIKTQMVGLLILRKFIRSLILFYILWLLSKKEILYKITQTMKVKPQIEDGDSVIIRIMKWLRKKNHQGSAKRQIKKMTMKKNKSKNKMKMKIMKSKRSKKKKKDQPERLQEKLFQPKREDFDEQKELNYHLLLNLFE